MARVLILGGGFGGVSTAHHLRTLAPEHEVLLVSRDTHFMMGFRKNAELTGSASMDQGRRPLTALESRGVRVVHGSVTAVDADARAVEVDGRRLGSDALVVALGAETEPGAIPGLRDHAHNVYDPREVPEAAAALARMQAGRVAIGIFGAPYQCPPAPYELALLAGEAARERGARLELGVFTPQPMSLPVLGPTGCDTLESFLAAVGVAFTPNAKAERVEAGRVVLQDGSDIGFDLLLAVPPHRCPKVLVDAGLAEAGGWVKVDAATLETAVDGVSAIGDCTAIPLATGQPLPKAGVLAEAEGRVVAERIAARLHGLAPDAVFDGHGACYLETGAGEAMLVRGRFLAEPAPQVELVGPSADLLAEKTRYERDTLDAWFGPAGRILNTKPPSEIA